MVGSHIYADLELRLQFFHVGAFISNIGGRRVNRRLSLSAYLHVRLEDIPPLRNKDVIVTKTRTVAVVCVIYCSTHQQNKQSDQKAADPGGVLGEDTSNRRDGGVWWNVSCSRMDTR